MWAKADESRGRTPEMYKPHDPDWLRARFRLLVQVCGWGTPWWEGDATGRDPGKELNELRRAVAELLGEDPATWPRHGNAPLAIAAVVARRLPATQDHFIEAPSQLESVGSVRVGAITLEEAQQLATRPVIAPGHAWVCVGCKTQYQGTTCPTCGMGTASLHKIED